MPNDVTSLTLVVPAFNESEIILHNVAELNQYMSEKLPDVTYEVLVIDDGSDDGMGAMLDAAAAATSNLAVFHHPYNMGRGAAVRTAIRETSTAYMIVFDADLSYSPDHIKPLLEPLMNGTAEVTLASPYHPDGLVENVPFIRAAMSRVGNQILTRSFDTPLHTATCIVRGYTREVLDHLELNNTGKELHLEVLYKIEMLGFRIREIPARLIWRDRKRGQSKKEGIRSLLHNPVFKMRSVILSHFLFNFITRPKFLFVGPVLAGIAATLYGLLSLVYAFIDRVSSGHAEPFRATLIEGNLTLLMTLSSFIISIFFLFFFFIASQMKHYFEEQYVLSTRSQYLLKKVTQNLAEKY